MSVLGVLRQEVVWVKHIGDLIELGAAVDLERPDDYGSAGGEDKVLGN